MNCQRLNGQVAMAAAVCTILRAALRELAFRAPRVAPAVRKASASRTRSVICDLAISPLSISVSLRYVWGERYARAKHRAVIARTDRR